MPQFNRYEQQFLDALKDIFVGAKVEGLGLKNVSRSVGYLIASFLVTRE